MAIGVSPQRLREVRFAEQWRGYRTDEVDEFVEQVAEAFDRLEQRLGEAAERAARAERRLLDRGSDDDVGRALVLAQRTADATLRDAESEAARLVADAEQRARTMLSEAEEGLARFEAEREARAQRELHDLNERRAALESDVARLGEYVERQRRTLAEELRAHLTWLESGTHLEEPPGVVSGVTSRPARSKKASDGPTAEAAERGSSWSTSWSTPPAESPGAATEAVPGSAFDEAGIDFSGIDLGDAGSPGPDASEGAGGPDAPQPDTPEAEDARDDSVVVVFTDPAAAENASQVPPRTGGVAADDRGADDRGADDRGADKSGNLEDDPFIAELRRAVEDPEPLGPRDESEEWVDGGDVYGEREGSSQRRRRRRQR